MTNKLIKNQKPLTDLEKKNEIAHIELLRHQIFDLANSYAGNDSGNAALFFHAAANELLRGIQCLEKDNPPAPIPMRFMMASLGMGE